MITHHECRILEKSQCIRVFDVLVTCCVGGGVCKLDVNICADEGKQISGRLSLKESHWVVKPLPRKTMLVNFWVILSSEILTKVSILCKSKQIVEYRIVHTQPHTREMYRTYFYLTGTILRAV